MPPKGYKNVTIPEGLVIGIDDLLKELEQADISTGYTNPTEFIKDAIRRRIEQLRQIYLLGEPHGESPRQDH